MPTDGRIGPVVAARHAELVASGSPPEYGPDAVDLVVPPAGIVPLSSALRAAKEKGSRFELVLVNDRARPPLVRVRGKLPPLPAGTPPPRREKSGTPPAPAAQVFFPKAVYPNKRQMAQLLASDPLLKELAVGTGINKKFEPAVAGVRAWLAKGGTLWVKVFDKHAGMPGGGRRNRERVMARLLKALEEEGDVEVPPTNEGIKTVAKIVGRGWAD